MSKKSKIVEMGKDRFLALLESHTQSEVAKMFGYLNPDGSGNGGVISNIMASLGWRETGGTRKPAKSSAVSVGGYLPGRVTDWAIRKLGMDPDDGDTLPEGFGPENFLDLPDVHGETVSYLRLISRLEPEKELAPFRAWLGCGLTRAERAEQAKIARIARIENMDADRETAEIRFESSRYDAAITAFYAE